MRLAAARNLRQQLHWPVLLPMALLILMGIVALSDISIHIRGSGWIGGWEMKQLRWVLVGAAVATAPNSVAGVEVGAGTPHAVISGTTVAKMKVRINGDLRMATIIPLIVDSMSHNS